MKAAGGTGGTGFTLFNLTPTDFDGTAIPVYHIRQPAPGEKSPVILNFDSQYIAYKYNAVFGPITDLTAAAVTSILASPAAIYDNVRSAVRPGAVVRGQLGDSAQNGSSFVVNVTDDLDDGTCGTAHCSLREAVNAANGLGADGKITFASPLFDTAQTIALGSGLPQITTGLTVVGPGARLLKVEGGAIDNFDVQSSGTLNLSGLTVSGVNNSDGSGISGSGSVTALNCAFEAHQSGVKVGGEATFVNCTFSGNLNGMVSTGATGPVALVNCTLSKNIGRAINDSATAGTTVANCTISGNSVGVFTGGDVTLKNSICAGNNTLDLNIFTDGGNNIAGGTAEDAGLEVGNGGSPVLKNNGGQVDTIALVPGGAATDAGDNALTADSLDQDGDGNTSEPISYDARGAGFSRIAAGRVDIGAYELPDTTQTGSDFEVNVTDDLDDGICGTAHCSLREAVNAANGDGVDSEITFDTTIFATQQTITLGGTELGVANNGKLLITPPAAGLILDGASKSRIFNVADDANLSFSGFSLRNGDGRAESGGAIYCEGTLTISRSTFSDNVVNGTGTSGGAILMSTGTLIIDRSSFTGNKADAASGLGGALYNFRSSVKITECTFTGNSAGSSGGVIFTQSSLADTAIIGCTLSGNSASNGGAIDHEQGTMSMVNCTLSDNTATASGYGGAVRNFASLTVRNCTFSDNTAQNGGGIYNAGTLSIGNTLFKAGTTGQNLLGGSGNVNSLGHNLSDDATGPDDGNTDRLGTELLLDTGGLQNNGGPTQTIALQSDSPAIDAGDNALIPVGITTDQRGDGFPRVVGGKVDIGAYEANYDSPQTGTGAEVNAVDDYDDGTCGLDHCSLREAINATNANADDSTISFNTTVFATARTIDLTGELPALSSDMTIDGPALGVTVHRSSGGAYRLFTVTAGKTVMLKKLNLSNGLANGLATETPPGERGGAIYNSGALSLLDCTVATNQASYGGGVFIAPSGTLSITRCTLKGNSAGNGAGIYNKGVLTVSNSTLFGNTSSGGAGGGIYNAQSATINLTTVAENSAIQGGGIYAAAAATLDLHNSIISGNTATVAGPDVKGKVDSGSYNIVRSGNGLLNMSNGNSGNKVGIDPLLSPAGPADNGGLTQTIALEIGSPAINAGSNALIAPGTAMDQRGTGFLRVVAGRVDMGAFEDQTETTQSGENFIVNTVDDYDDGACGVTHCSLREAINAANLNIGASIITFDANVFAPAKTIELNGPLPALGSAITINGPTAGVTVHRNTGGDYRIFTANAGTVVTLSKLTLSNGLANGSPLLVPPGERGGAIFNGGALTLSECTLSSNQAAYGGGVFNAPAGTLSLSKCTLSGNTAGNGSGIYNKGSLTVSNCTLFGNTGSGGAGGAIYNAETASVYSSTIAGNGASQGGGIYNTTGATLILHNSIVSGNSAGVTGPDVKGKVDSGSYNIVQSASGLLNIANGANGNQVGVDPLLSAAGLAGNGGLTKTIALQNGSPALDKGKDINATGEDQRGLARPFDDPLRANAAGGDGSDIGSFEQQTALPVSSALLVMRSRAPAPGVTAKVQANVSAGSLTLAFAGSAPKGGFRVTVNGRSVDVLDAAITQSGGQTVTLLLADGTLEPGDAIEVTWFGGGGRVSVE